MGPWGKGELGTLIVVLPSWSAALVVKVSRREKKGSVVSPSSLGAEMMAMPSSLISDLNLRKNAIGISVNIVK